MIKLSPLLAKSFAMFLIASTFAYGQTPDQHAGEIQINLGPGQEPAKYQFNVGLDQTAGTDSEEQTANAIVEIEKGTGDGVIQVYDIEGEPEIVVPETVKRNLVVQRIRVPRVVVDAFEKARAGLANTKFGQFVKDVYVPPTRQDKILGIVFGSMRAALAASVFYASPRLGWWLATKMTITVTAATYINNRWQQTLMNVFTYGIRERKTRLGNAINWARVFTLNLIWDVGVAEGINAVGGQNTAYQALGNAVVSNSAGTAFGSDRTVLILSEAEKAEERAYFEALANGINEDDAQLKFGKETRIRVRQSLSFAYKILVNPWTFLIQAADNVGLFHSRFHIIGYEVRPTIATTLGIYAGLVAANHLLRKPLVKALYWTYDTALPTVTRLGNFLYGPEAVCEEVFTANSQRTMSVIDQDFTEPAL